eukprot:g46324.t1
MPHCRACGREYHDLAGEYHDPEAGSRRTRSKRCLGLCNTVRVTVKKVEEGFLVNWTFCVKRVLLDCCWFQAADIFCLQDFPSAGDFNMPFRSIKQCEHLLKVFKEKGAIGSQGVPTAQQLQAPGSSNTPNQEQSTTVPLLDSEPELPGFFLTLSTPDHENMKELGRDFTGWRTVKPLFESPVDWWETVKGNTKRFFILKSVQRSALGSMIHPDQTCAASGRTSSETFALVRDMITYVHNSKVDAYVISLDQKKASHRISHTYIEKDASLRGETISGSRGLQVKAPLYMDDITVFCTDLLSVRRLMSICDQSELASGAKVWPIPRTCAITVTRVIFHVIWRSKVLHVYRDAIYKALDKELKNTPNTALILMATFVFYLSLVLPRMGLASLLQNCPNHLSFIKKFAKKSTFDRKSPGSGQHIVSLRPCRFILSSSVTQGSVLYGLFPGTHTGTNINCAWTTINLVKDTLLSARNLLVFQSKELTSNKCCRLAHSMVQGYMLRDTLKLRATATK